MSIALLWSSTSGLSDLPAQSCLITAGEAETINFTQVTGQSAVNVTGYTLKFTLSTERGADPSLSLGDSAFSSKTSGGAFTLSLTAANTDEFSSRAWFYEVRRTDAGYETLLSSGYVTIYSSTNNPANTPTPTLLSLDNGGTESDLGETGPGVLVQASAGAPLTIVAYATFLGTNLGGTTVGQAVFTSTNPSAVTFLRANANNTVTWLSASDFRTAIGAGTGSGDLTKSGAYVDNQILRADGTAGAVQGSTPTISDTGDIAGVNNIDTATIYTDSLYLHDTTDTYEVNVDAPTLTDDRTATFRDVTGYIAVIAGTLAVATSKTFTVNNTLTFTGTDGSSVAFGAGGTVVYGGGTCSGASSGTNTGDQTTFAASAITGTTLAANVVTSSITTVGTLVGGATGAGFTISLASSTISGRLPLANGAPTVYVLAATMTASGASSATLAIVTDGTTAWSVNLAAATKYRFRIVFHYTCVSGVGYKIGLSATNSLSATSLRWSVGDYVDAVNAGALTSLTSFTSLTAGNAGAQTVGECVVAGAIVTNAAGTFNVQFASGSNNNTATMTACAFFEMQLATN